jgi:hypothetical protein
MIKGARRSIAAVVAALGMGVGGAVWATSAASAASAAPARPAAVHECTSGQLAVWVSPDRGNGAAGSIFYPLDFTNTSNRTCFLVGWPGVSATNQNGAQLGSPAQRDSSVARKVVTIAPNATAHAVLRYIDVQIDPTAGCRAKTASFLRVFAPDQRSANTAFFDLPVCSVKGRIYMTISRIAPGA